MSDPDEGTARLTVVVSSCDLFFDAWVPMFCLWRKYWPDCRFPMVLITNHLALDPGPVQAMRLGEDRGWANNLIETLRRLDTPYIIYIQEDHFLLAPVDDAGVRQALELIEREDLDFVTFRAENVRPGAVSHSTLPVFYPEPSSRHGVFCDPCIWRKESLLRLLVEGETAWNFLKTGRERAAKFEFRRAQFDRRQMDRCPIHYMKRSGIRESLWHIQGLRWVLKHRIPVWPFHRGLLLQSMHLRRDLKKEPGNRWLRWKYLGFGVASGLTRWQKKLSVAHLRKHLAKVGPGPLKVHAEVARWEREHLS